MRLWLIPLTYVGGSVLCGLVLPRLEQTYLARYAFDISVASAQAMLSAVASGMMALTGIVFAMAFFMVQFSAIAYSPRLDIWFARDRTLYHSLGVFTATFTLSLFTLAWVDRGGSGKVPFFSTFLVALLVIASMLLFSRLVQRLSDLQIMNVLHLIGDQGRRVIREAFLMLDERRATEWTRDRGAAERLMAAQPVQTVVYSGRPRVVAKLNMDALVRQAQRHGATIVMACAVGDTLIEGSIVFYIHGAKEALVEKELLRSVQLGNERTFEQDPKYPIRLLVDIAIKALSPGINDPTTAVQAIDQIEDLLRRLGGHDLDAGLARDSKGVLRLIVPMPTWEDYLALAFDEIRQYGLGSVQVMRRLRAALTGIAKSPLVDARADAVRRYIRHLEHIIQDSALDAEDRITALQEDRQGLGLSRRPEDRFGG